MVYIACLSIVNNDIANIIAQVPRLALHNFLVDVDMEINEWERWTVFRYEFHASNNLVVAVVERFAIVALVETTGDQLVLVDFWMNMQVSFALQNVNCRVSHIFPWLVHWNDTSRLNMHVKVVSVRVVRFVHASSETCLFRGVENIAPVRGRVVTCIRILREVVVCLSNIFSRLD